MLSTCWNLHLSPKLHLPCNWNNLQIFGNEAEMVLNARHLELEEEFEEGDPPVGNHLGIGVGMEHLVESGR